MTSSCRSTKAFCCLGGRSEGTCQRAETAPEPVAPAAAPEEMVRFLTGMPKAELHLHLEGSLSPRTVADLAVRNGMESLRTVEEVERSLAGREPGLLGFLSHYNQALRVLRTEQDFQRAKNPDHLAANFPTECELCHLNETTWQGAVFEHSSFPLTGQHSAVACEACHVGGRFAGTMRGAL